ncbi:MAG: DUF1844 domain-containing protein [Acidobacteria bacterium]|nr:DUF1844 domain-containing protein [Acidobacteriota bacterium]
MADEKVESSGFKVVDRRPFTSEGERVPSQLERTQEPEARDQVREDTEPAAAQESEPTVPEDSARFATLVSYLSTTAMFQLGLLPGPGGEYISPDFVNCRRTIDLLEVLQEKTRGNLSAEEARLLDEVLYELRMSFIEVQKQRVSKRK